jgi:hypothetical protein
MPRAKPLSHVTRRAAMFDAATHAKRHCIGKLAIALPARLENRFDRMRETLDQIAVAA